ncbi:MAG: M28 family peptidase [Anaerolineales bacterium]
MTFFGLGVVLALAAAAFFHWRIDDPVVFDGERAYQDVRYQVALGARTPGSTAHAQTRAWIVHTLQENHWQAESQPAQMMGHDLYNLVGKRGHGRPWVIIGAHYDSRMLADQTPSSDQPVPGANDGASGVAVLLELARTLPADLPGEVWLVFFDGEDNGDLPGWDWILGSRAFAQSLSTAPDAVVIVDMIGDSDLNVYLEGDSDPQLARQIWDTAAALGYQQFIIPRLKYTMLDDHLPFRQIGAPAVDLIDFDYPYWHTTADTADKVSPHSLQVIGDTLTHWLLALTPED